jgi:hypothetical protein
MKYSLWTYQHLKAIYFLQDAKISQVILSYQFLITVLCFNNNYEANLHDFKN